MIRKLSVSAVALASLGFALPVMASETVNIDVTVQEIAELTVANPTGTMVIDSTTDSFMGNPSSSGSVFNNATSTLAEIRLDTNYDIDNIEVSFPTVRGGNALGRVRGFDNTTYFGRATNIDANAASQTLGVWPQAGVLDGPGGTIVGGGGSMQTNPADGNAIYVTNAIGNDVSGGVGAQIPFGNGTHYIGLGVSTNWTNTLNGEPVFAEPGTYAIELTAMISSN